MVLFIPVTTMAERFIGFDRYRKTLRKSRWKKGFMS